LQTFLVNATSKAMDNLIAAVERIPEDKRNWSPMGDARSALDQAAECAMLNEGRLLRDRAWPADFDFNDYLAKKAALVEQGWPAIKELLVKNTQHGIEAIKAVRDEELENTIQMPWGEFTVAQIASYPSWNMSYHEGQCNYIASMLGTLE
jgi:hypothetical protein